MTNQEIEGISILLTLLGFAIGCFLAIMPVFIWIEVKKMRRSLDVFLARMARAARS